MSEAAQSKTKVETARDRDRIRMRLLLPVELIIYRVQLATRLYEARPKLPRRLVDFRSADLRGANPMLKLAETIS